jgi:hypothetical protein
MLSLSAARTLPEVPAPSTRRVRRSVKELAARCASKLKLLPRPVQSVVHYSASTRPVLATFKLCDTGLAMIDDGFVRFSEFVLKDQIADSRADLGDRILQISVLQDKLVQVQAERSLLFNQVFRPHS